MRTSLCGVLLGAVALCAPSGVSAQSDFATCERAVAALLSGAGRVTTQEENRSFSYGRVLAWRSADGSAGICRIDEAGRVFGVEVERFGRPSSPSAPEQSFSTTCESVDDRRQECRIPRNWRVTLERQLSRTTCREGATWGAYGDRIWVDDGCRGQFRVSPPAGGGGWDEEQTARSARAACEHKADRQGMEVLSVQRVWRMDRTQWAVDMTVRLRRLQFAAECRYNERTGYVEISSR